MSEPITARPAGFFRDVRSVAIRALQQLPRDLAFVLPALAVPTFFLVVNIGALQDVAGFTELEIDYKAFQLPVAIVFAVTGISRASALVLDIQDGYFDRLLLTPVSRRALLLGLMVSDFVLVLMLAVPVTILGFAIGVRFPTGILGVVVFLLMGAFWGVAFTGFPYTIALRTGNPSAVSASFVLFFPFAFMTTTFLPLDSMTGWLAEVARYNPVTYLLAGLRSLFVGWQFGELGKGMIAIIGLGVVSQTLAFSALKSRIDGR